MVKKRETIKRAIRDRKLIKQASLQTTLPKIKNMLMQSVLNEGSDPRDQLSRQDVRKILGVQIPQESKDRQTISDMQQNKPSAITDQEIAKRNNHNVDRNKVEMDGKQGWQGETPAGIIRQSAEHVSVGEDENKVEPSQQEIAMRLKSKNEVRDIQSTPYQKRPMPQHELIH